MSPNSWADNAQEAFLQSYMELYLTFKTKRRYREFWVTLNREWFARWPERRTLFEKKPESEPLSGGESKLLGEAIDKRKAQLRNWFRWRVNNSNFNRAAAAAAMSQSSSFDTILESKNTRRRSKEEIYYSEFKDRVNTHLADNDYSTTGARLNAGKSCAKKLLAEEDEATKAQIDSLYESQKARDICEEKPVVDPESIKRDLDNLPYVLKNFAEMIKKRTRYTVSFICAGPDPSRNWEITSISCHPDELEGGKTFSSLFPAEEHKFLQAYQDFAEQLFPVAQRNPSETVDEDDEDHEEEQADDGGEGGNIELPKTAVTGGVEEGKNDGSGLDDPRLYTINPDAPSSTDASGSDASEHAAGLSTQSDAFLTAPPVGDASFPTPSLVTLGDTSLWSHPPSNQQTDASMPLALSSTILPPADPSFTVTNGASLRDFPLYDNLFFSNAFDPSTDPSSNPGMYNADSATYGSGISLAGDPNGMSTTQALEEALREFRELNSSGSTCESGWIFPDLPGQPPSSNPSASPTDTPSTAAALAVQQGPISLPRPTIPSIVTPGPALRLKPVDISLPQPTSIPPAVTAPSPSTQDAGDAVPVGGPQEAPPYADVDVPLPRRVKRKNARGKGSMPEPISKAVPTSKGELPSGTTSLHSPPVPPSSKVGAPIPRAGLQDQSHVSADPMKRVRKKSTRNDMANTIGTNIPAFIGKENIPPETVDSPGRKRKHTASNGSSNKRRKGGN